MSRLVLAASLLALAGCSNFRERFAANTDVVAEAGGQRLATERVRQWMRSSQGLEPSRDAARFVADLWVDHILFAEAAVTGKLPTDSAGIARAMWSELAERRAAHWHDTLLARRATVSPGAVDSAYRGDEVRVLQHIVFRVPQDATPAARTAQRRKAEATLARLKGGADFGTLAAQLSDDPGSKTDAGFLPPTPRGRFVPAFDSAGWRLAPGALSDVVQTAFGYHIIKRPPAEAVHDRLATYLRQSAGPRLDSIYMDSLALVHKVEVKSGAAAAMRTAVEDPEEARRSKKVLVGFKDGGFTLAEFFRWLQVLPPQYSAQLAQVPDSVLTRFAKVLAQNVLLLRQADSAGITVTPAEWSTIAQDYRSQVDTLRQAMGLNAPELTDTTRPAGERAKLAAQKVDEYFDQVVAGRQRLRPIPAGLAGMLRDQSRARVYKAGVNRAVELVKAEQAADSAKRAKTDPVVRPAPGGPPIPGATQPPADSAHRGQ